tara:strand:+ start:562 stop:663 length:102 start_codon:yes stop_codon:yes gene_type:complete
VSYLEKLMAELSGFVIFAAVVFYAPLIIYLIAN